MRNFLIVDSATNKSESTSSERNRSAGNSELAHDLLGQNSIMITNSIPELMTNFSDGIHCASVLAVEYSMGIFKENTIRLLHSEIDGVLSGSVKMGVYGVFIMMSRRRKLCLG